MAFKGLNTTTVCAILLIAGTATLTWGIAQKQYALMAVGALLLVITLLIYHKGLNLLKEKCYLMLESIRNNDYSFRLPTSYLNDKERVLQNTINEFGKLMNEQKQQMVQHEKFYEQIMSSVSTGILVTDENNLIVMANPSTARLLGLPTLSTLNQLERYGKDVTDLFKRMQPGEKHQLHLQTNKDEAHLSITCVRTTLNGHTVRIFVLNDIRSELDEKELESWIKLSRILTHEIMNGIAPISSISDTFMQRDDIADSPLYEGIRAIHDTSAGLISFVDSYRKFSYLQKPQPEAFIIAELLQQIKSLDLIPSHISLTTQISPDNLMLFADPNLVRQMLINLIKNAVQAISQQAGRIHIQAYASSSEHVFISVSNNGPVIPNDVAEQIFVPFFTTKSEGSGIGLSLSRQIMKLSGGSITLLKAHANGWPVTFLLEFN